MNSSEHSNAFDLVRIFAAFSVLYLHFTGYMLNVVGIKSIGLTVLRGTVNFFPPTVILFSISGFLTMMSLSNHDYSPMDFIKRKISRIYFDLWICMAVYLIVLLVVAGDFFDFSIVKWIFIQGAGLNFTPACFKSFGTGSINGALWYITVLIQLYFVIYLLKRKAKWMNSRVAFTVFIVILAAMNVLINYVCTNKSATIQKIFERTFLPYAIWFFIGAYIQKFEVYKSDKMKYFFAGMCVFYALFRGLGVYDYGYYCGLVTGVMCAIISSLAAFVIRHASLKNDMAYGLYLYHWLFLNLIMHFKLYDKMNWLVCLALFTAFTMIFASVFRYKNIKHLLTKTVDSRSIHAK